MLGIAAALRRRRRPRGRAVLDAHLVSSPAVAAAPPAARAGLDDLMDLLESAELARFVAVPSEAVADLWRRVAAEEGYAALCRDAFGEVLLPRPAATVPADLRPDGELRAFTILCRRDGMDPARPTAMPALFLVDAACGWEPGLHWELTGTLPAVRRTGDTEPGTVAAWPELPAVDALLPPRGRRRAPR